MIYNLNITKMLYSFKHINELYYKLSCEAAKKCGITKPEADILILIKNNQNKNTRHLLKTKFKHFTIFYLIKYKNRILVVLNLQKIYMV